MFASTPSHRGEAATFLGSPIEWLAGLATRLVRAASQRRALGELTRLDDRMLRDIGLFRGDIDAAESLPLGCDPIALLASRRMARRNTRFVSRHY